MKRFLGQLRRAFPLRPGGMVLLLLAAGLVLQAPKEGDFLLYPAGLVALLLVVVCVAVVTLGTLWLRRTLVGLPAGLPQSLETEAPSATGFLVPSLGRFAILDVSVEWVDPAGVSVKLELNESKWAEVVTCARRGRHTKLIRRFSVQDVFGLAGLCFDLSWDQPFRVVPAAARANQQLLAGRAQGESMANPAGQVEGDLVEMRAYAHGDSLRHVLWKVYARTRKLLVRMPERALAPGPISVAFFVAGADDEASAGAARLYVEAGLLGPDLLFCADGASSPARTAPDALDQVIDSAKVRSQGGDWLDALAAQVPPGRLASCLVFAPALDGPWREKVVGFVKRRGLDATVVIGVDEAGELPTPQSRWQSWLFEAPATLDLARPSLSRLRGALQADGLAVQVLHRGTGQVV